MNSTTDILTKQLNDFIEQYPNHYTPDDLDSYLSDYEHEYDINNTFQLCEMLKTYKNDFIQYINEKLTENTYDNLFSLTTDAFREMLYNYIIENYEPIDNNETDEDDETTDE